MRSIAAVLALFAGCALVALAADPPSPKLVIAHRGASGYLPEHTLPAIALAHAQGADYLEQDVVLSKDDVPVVLHDVHIDTVTDVAQRFPDRKRPDGRFYAIDFTASELKQLAASERFDPRTGRAVYPSRFPVGQGSFQVPTLEEELQLIQGLNRTTGREAGVYPEIKYPAWHRAQGRDPSRIVVSLLARYGYKTKADKVYLQCFEPVEVKRIRAELGYQGRLVQLIEGGGTDRDTAEQKHLRTTAGLAEIAKVVDGIGPSLVDLVTRKPDGTLAATTLVRDAHAQGLVVHPYTFRADAVPPGVPSFDDLLRLAFIDMGVEGVFTDHPDRAVAFLRSLPGKR
jgi:glycerophosphoryl diester phosphodiesterase